MRRELGAVLGAHFQCNSRLRSDAPLVSLEACWSACLDQAWKATPSATGQATHWGRLDEMAKCLAVALATQMPLNKMLPTRVVKRMQLPSDVLNAPIAEPPEPKTLKMEQQRRKSESCEHHPH